MAKRDQRTIQFRMIGFDELALTLASICEALANAYVEAFDIEIDYCDRRQAITWNDMAVTSMDSGVDKENCRLVIRPTASMLLFIGYIMTLLPSRARVIWSNGWPIISCPPRDDRDVIDDPTPPVPNQLEPV